ncbi:MAG: translation initiation factor IF-3 [Clostridia bacterium]|nr:translation initiation factor IF-3 [Clostridia bacterium]
MYFCKWRCLIISSKELSINEEIKLKEVRLVGVDGEQLGVTSSRDALEKAYALGLDLVLIAPGANPPVCRIMDYGKYRYDRDKKEKEAKKKQQTVDIKEVQLSCRIDTHDFNTKANNAIRFLKGGDKVRVTLLFKGREMAHTDAGLEIIKRFIEACAEFGGADKAPVLDGRRMNVTISPIKK